MIFFLVFLTAAVKIEILPRYAGVDKGSVLITGTLQDYGLAAESAEGTYAFFYFHKAPAPVAVNVISSPSSSVQISESTFFSTWGALQADFLSAQASLSQWMLIVLSLSNPQSFQLDFTIFIGKQRLSFSVQDYYTASQSAFLPSDYFTIYGSTGIIHSLTIFPEVVSPVLISQYYLLPTYQCNSDIPLILNIQVFSNYIYQPVFDQSFELDSEIYLNLTDCENYLCVDQRNPDYAVNSFSCSLQENNKIIQVPGMYAVCIPDSEMLQNGELIIPMSPVYYNKRLKFRLHEFSDEYFNSFDSLEFTYLEYGFYGDYLTFVIGNDYSAELPLGELKYFTDVSVTAYMCADPCNLIISGTRITIVDPSSESYCMELIAYAQPYVSCFVLTGQVAGDFSITITPDLFHAVSVVVLPIAIVDSLYSDIEMHTFSSNFGVIHSATLYLPLGSRQEIVINSINIGGSTAEFSVWVNTNQSPVISEIPTLVGWVGCYIIYSIIVTDLDSDIISYSGDFTYDKNTIIYSADAIGEFIKLVSVTDGFVIVTQNVNVQVVDQPEIDLTVKYCIKNRICYFSVSGLDGTLIISQMTVSENYAYWVPGNTGEYLLDFVLTSKFSSVITGKFTFIVNEATDIDLVPTRYYIVNSEFELTLNPISVLNDYTTTGTGGLEISGLTLTGTVSEIDYYSVKVQETLSENYVNLVFSMICDDPPTATDLSFTMSYGEPWRYELDYQAFSTYSVTGLDCEDLNGILTLDFPESSNVYTVTIKDLRFPQYDFTINLNVQYPPRLLPIDQTQLLFYTSAEQVILIYYETAPDVSLDFDSTIFTAEVHSGYIQLTTYLEDTYYNLLSYITITNDGFSDTVFFYIFVYLKLLPIFSEISFPCEIGKNYSIDLRNYLIFYLPEYQELSLSINSISITDWILKFTASASNDFTVVSCIDELCTSQDYLFTCFYPLVITVSDPIIYADVESIFSINVYMNNVLLEMNELKSIWVEGGLEGMEIEQTGILVWTPSQSQSGLSVSVKIHAECLLNPEVTYFQVVLIEVLPHLLPDVSMERVVSSDMMCAITLESPNANCYLLRTLENIFGYSDVIYSVVYPTTSEIFIGNNIVIWDRSQVSANYLDLSSSIILMLTDQEQGFVYTYPFWFTPNYIPVISDLNTQTDPVLTAFFQCSWERTFTIQVGDLIYPASLFSPITFSNSASETITLTSGQLSWTPNVSSQSVTLIISFTGPGDLTTTKNFEVYVNSNSLPVCTIDPELLKVYKQKTFTIDLSIVCSDSDGEEILFEIIEGPDGMTLDNSVISWSTSLEDLGVKRKVTIFMTNQFGTCPEYYSFEIVPQPKIKISLETQDLYYGVAFRSVVLLENREFFEVHMLRYSISTSGNILIDSEYGIITWESPNQSETIQVTVAVDSSFYVADSKTSTFSLEIVSSSVVPEFNLGLPLSLEKKQVYANEMWQVEINCICPLDTPSITIISFTNTMELIGNILQWTPPVTFYDSGLVSLTCASSLFQTATTYSFILNPVNSLDPVPTCENINIDINYHNSYQYQTEFNWIIRDFSLYDLSLTIAENNFPNMKIFKRGLAYWNNADRPSSLINTILIDDTSKTNTCEIAIVFTNSTDPPDIINNNNLLCQVPPCTLEILTTGDPSAIYISNSDYILQSSNTFTWDPPGGVLIQETIFTAENEADQKSIDVVLCQNSECRKWPVIETIESDSCVIINQVLTCTYIYPETVIYLKITGRNFVGNSEVIVGNKYCVVTVQSNSEITCRLPPPSFGLSTYIVTVHRLDIDMYSPGKVIDYSHYYEAKALILDLGDLNPLIITPDSNGYYWVPINADLLFKTCTCYSQSTPGVFTYKSSIYSECKFEGLLSQEYTLTICCFGSCTSLTFYAVNDLTLSGPSPSEIYAHGLYPITISYSYTGPCTPSQIIFKLNSHLLRSSSPCSYSATLIVPPQDSSTTSIEIFISLNNGLTYSANSLTLTLSGFCSIGEYQLNGLCTLCPIGYMCDYNFSDKLSFFFTPIPCELGYYQDSEGQDSCIICPLGHQCFCRAGTSPIVCDAGFVCDELGIVKRWKACPKGNYCEEGTESYTFGDYKGPELCPEGNYCIYGVFTNISDPLDPYHPRPCENGASCPAGSSNPQGVINCEIGYFCRAGTIDKSNTDIFQFSEQCVSGKCQCPLGYYCPSSQLQSPVLCPKGKYQPNYASPSCEECPVGYYCPWNALVSPKSAIICEVGYRCPGSQSDQIKCSIGQYQNLEGQSACVNCKIGYYAPSLGMTACIICNEAYYCPTEGLVSPVPCLAMYYCYLPGINYDVQSINQTESDVFPSDLVASSEMRPQQCPKGYYCPLKSKQPTGCPIGSYQGFSGSTQCIGCPDGKLCPFTSMASPEDCPAGYYCADNKQAACPAGYYCLLNTETADPSSTSSNKPLPCPTGTYCTGGNTMGTSNSSDAYSAQLCSPGFYNDLPAQSACLPCPQGYECLTEGLSTPSICNAGTYRPFDIAQQYCIDCAEGTYNPDFGSISADSCINCIAGIVCNISGAIDQTSSYPCPAGYFCLEGTSRNTRNNNPCPAGYFCLEGTASYDEALVNPCPTGRYCASATAVDIITDCTDPTACNIGSICTANFYCPQGTAAMVECPSGTTSDNGAKSVDDCIRAADGFYLISVVQTAPVITSINVVEFSYYEFNLNFLQEFPNASMPQDYQLLISLTFPSRFRRLGETTTKNLLVSNNNYGTRLGVPLIYSSKDILVAGVDLKLGMQVNVNAVVSFEFQFLNSTYNKNYGWDNFEVPVDSMVSSLATDAASGFVCVLTRTIGAAIEDPINIYKTIQINDQNSAESAPVFEQRFSLSLITSDYSSVLENSTPKQNTTSLWATTSENNLVIPYLPYVTNCFPDYGANLPINELIKNKKCEFEPNPVNIKPLEVYTQVTGDRCNYKLTCDYIVDITNVKRSTRWYEAYTEEHNSRDPNKLNIPIFYISKNLLPRSTISNAILSQNVQIDFETTEVNVKIEMENRSWTIGDVPKSIELHLGYYQPLLNSTQILYAQMILKDMQPNSEFSDTLYNFTFHYFPLTWIQCFDLNAFDSSDYIFLTFVLASSAVATIGVFAVLSYFLCPKTWKIRGFSYVFSNSIDSSCGFFLAFIPVLLIIFGIWMVLYYAGALDYNVGNYSDTVPITDVNTDRVLMYRTGRLGISFFVLGLACISWAVDLAVPKKELQGLGYEAEKQELLEVKENPKEQGPLSWALLIAIGLCIMLDIVGQMPEYSENYYIILPILLTFEYFSGLFSMWAVQDFYYATHFKISLKVGIGITVLNCKTLTGMIASSFIIYGFKLVTQGFLEKYSQFYLVAYVIKYFKKLRFNTGGNKTSSVNNIQSINETSEKSLSFIVSYLYPVMSLAIYLNYENMNYRMLQVHYFYFFLLNIFFLAYEPLSSFFINAIRSTRDSAYQVPELYEKVQRQYKIRNVAWSLSEASYEVPGLATSQECKSQCKVGWSVQYYFNITLTGLGVYLIVFSIKLWQFAEFAPFFDLWMSVVAVTTYAACFILKNICVKIGGKVLWKIPAMQKRYQYGIDGNAIQSRSDFISDAALKKEIKKLMYEENTGILAVSDLTQIVVEILKDTSSENLAKIKLFRVFNDLDLSGKLDLNKIFDSFKQASNAYSLKFIDKNINKKQDPLKKVALIKEKYEREGKTLGKYPSELVYPWTNKEESHNLTFN